MCVWGGAGVRARRHAGPTRRSSDLTTGISKSWARRSTESRVMPGSTDAPSGGVNIFPSRTTKIFSPDPSRSEEHTSELQSQFHLVCRLLLEKKKKTNTTSKLS